MRRRTDEPTNREQVLKALRDYLWGDGPNSLRMAIAAEEDRLPPEGRHHLAEAYRHIPTAVAALRKHFLPARLGAATTSYPIH